MPKLDQDREPTQTSSSIGTSDSSPGSPLQNGLFFNVGALIIRIGMYVYIYIYIYVFFLIWGGGVLNIVIV